MGLSPDGSTAFALVNRQFLRGAGDALVGEDDSIVQIGVLEPSGNGSFSRSADGGKTYSQISLLNNAEGIHLPGGGRDSRGPECGSADNRR